ncbi:MAG: MoaD/ThiS family protein [Candidatus Tectomicrobia bacterium]|nr:MoaD/ThiS family protein [Candidatus Tectomicrobia bacterium]
MPVVWIPSLMQDLTGGVEKVNVAGETLRQVILHLDETYPGVMERLCNEGRLKPTIAVVIDGRVTRKGFLEQVRDESEIHFIPAISGGV